jgi:hypothetical protein
MGLSLSEPLATCTSVLGSLTKFKPLPSFFLMPRFKLLFLVLPPPSEVSPMKHGTFIPYSTPADKPPYRELSALLGTSCASYPLKRGRAFLHFSRRSL